MKYFKSYEEGVTLECFVIPMGNDLSVNIYGGDTPHVGAVALSSEGNTDPNAVAVAMAERPGHKDGDVAKLVASALTRRLGCAVSCAVGIHLDEITHDQLKWVMQTSRSFVEEIALAYKEKRLKAWA